MKNTFTACLLILIYGCSFPGRQVQTDSTAQPLPVTFKNGLVLVQPVTPHGDTLTFLTDTGGSLLFYADAVRNLELKTVATQMQGMPIQAAFLPDFLPKASIPPPLFTNEMLKIRRQENIPPHLHALPAHDGILGQAWFSGRIWTFDYSVNKAWLHPNGNLPDHNPEDIIHLGFRYSADGARENNFPRIQVGIAGETYHMVLQTGNTIILTETAAAALPAAGARWMSSGFISESIFEDWRQSHPEWKIIDQADSYYGAAMIQVPEITIGNVTQGPAWFTMRRDFAYKQWMSRYTDQPVVGALGGNALQNLRITLDYINAKAIVQQPGS